MNVELDNNRSVHDLEAVSARGRAIGDPRAQTFLHLLNQRAFLPKDVIENHVKEYDDWIAVLNVVQGGWAKVERRGIRITDEGKEISSLIFKQASDQTQQSTT